MMSVRAMIDLLKEYPEDMRVVVSGYEQGYDDLSPEQISVIPLALNTGVHDWEGEHGDPEDHVTTSQEAVTTTEALAFHQTSN